MQWSRGIERFTWMLCFRSLLIQLCVTLNKRRPCLLSTSNELVTDSPAPLRFSCLGFLILLMRFIKQRNKTNFEKKKNTSATASTTKKKEKWELGLWHCISTEWFLPPPSSVMWQAFGPIEKEKDYQQLMSGCLIMDPKFQHIVGGRE